MDNTKLIQVLSTFSKDEFKQFGRFLRSPYFNNRSELVRYYDALKKLHPAFKETSLIKEQLFSKVYSIGYKDVLMRKLNSNMLGMAELFLANSAFDMNNIEAKKNLLKELSKRKLTKLFEQRFRDAEKVELKSSGTSGHYLNLYNLYHILNEYTVQTQKKSKKELVQKESDLLHHFKISRFLEFHLQLLNNEKVMNQKYVTHFYDSNLDYVSKHLDDFDLSVKVNYYMIMLLKRGSAEDFQKLKAIKNRSAAEMDIHQLYNVYINLTNFCLDMVYNGYPEYRKERYELDKEFVSLNLFSYKGYFPVSYFITAVDNAAYYKDHDWADKLISNHLKHIEPEHTDFAGSYCKALLEFAKGKYESVLTFLARINTKNEIWKMTIYVLSLKALYETSNYEQALLLADTCRHFLKAAQGIPEDRKAYYSKFIKLSTELIHVKSSFNRLKLENLRIRTAKTDSVREKEWLIQKISEIKK